MSADSDTSYLTVGRYLVWFLTSLITTALALVNGFYFHTTSKTYWAVYIPLQVCVVIPAFLYVCCSTPRPKTFCKGLLKTLHFVAWPIFIQMLQHYLLPWLARHWTFEVPTWASLDVIFVFSLGLSIGILAEFSPSCLFIEPVRFHWERAEVYLRPKTLNGNRRQRSSVDRKEVSRWFFNRLLIFFNRIFIILGLTMGWLPILLFARMNPEAWTAIAKIPSWSEFGRGLLWFLGYPLAFAFPILIWKCQVGLDCRGQDEQEPVVEEA
ncbi:hypothetical protein EG328_001284 [Venturia inaequalis]|uniref:Uncharacterized protein n=1 Tax=Venturia inaequalis TaxID=5025 RepID=A0A8H3VIZ7_VENIN|nr:hypothetical protein EG328_001284 [Venturia inaequalis]